MFYRITTLSIVLFCLIVASFPASAAFPVQIAPGAYAGQWDVSSVPSAFTGPQTLHLDPGAYTLRVGRQNAGAFSFNVDAAGNVTSQNAAAASGFGSTLTFNTVAVTIDPGAFNSAQNFWDIRNVTSGLTGVQNVVVVPGVGYLLQIGRIIPGGFIFDVDALGNVTSQNSAAATGVGATLHLNTTTITINPGAFSSPQNFWDLQSVTAGLTGPQNLTVVPGVSYFVRIGRIIPGGFFIDVGGSGAVSSQNAAAAGASGSTITFNTVSVFFNAGTFSSPQSFWDLNNVTSGLSSSQNLTLVPGVSYLLRVGRTAQGGFFIDIDAAGSVSSQNAAAAVGAGSTLSFNTSTINIDSGDYDSETNFWDVLNVTSGLAGSHSVEVVRGVSYSIRIGRSSPGGFFAAVDAAGDIVSQNSGAATTNGSTLSFLTAPIEITPSTSAFWRINNVTAPISGPATVPLVTGVGYLIGGPAFGTFTVANPCAVNPSQLSANGIDFEIGCGSLDADADGVPDATDNCPTDPNPDQIDVDLDGFGDVCDADLDGDGVANLLDNCPQFPNADQNDADGDGEGDVCDGDDDNDSVADLLDNCPFDSNVDQSDNDGDLSGDACDEDDDNDTIVDILDNCPFEPNPDQADFDGNGQGDVCDGDVDNDGVANVGDLCPLSPQGSAVNGSGCTGPQLIAMTCAIENFAQHGQYVSCVAHAANSAVEQGLLAPSEKARFVRDAAKAK